MAFEVIHGAVCIVGHGRPARLSPESVDALLDVFEHEGAAAQFNALWQAREALRAQSTFTLAGVAARRVVDSLAPQMSEAAE